MKKLYILFLAVITMNGFSQNFEVEEQKKALLFKATASWCAPCGDYHGVTDEIYNNHSDSILFLNGHVATSTIGDPYSGDMHNLINEGGGIPSYSLSGVKLADWPPTIEMILNESASFFGSPIIANIAFDYHISGDELTINTTTKFFQDSDADNFYVGAMVLENNITVSQNHSTGYETQTQHRVQRTVLGTLIDLGEGKKLWADEITTGSVASGSTFDHTLTRSLSSAWDYTEIDIIVVIWQRIGDEFLALSSEDVAQVIDGNDNGLEKLTAIEMYPNPAQGYFNIRFDKFRGAQVIITNQLGKEIERIQANRSDLRIDIKDYEKGLYFVTIKDNESFITKSLIII